MNDWMDGRDGVWMTSITVGIVVLGAVIYAAMWSPGFSPAAVET